MEDGSLVNTLAMAHHLSPSKADREISAENWGVDDVFPPYDISFGPET